MGRGDCGGRAARQETGLWPYISLGSGSFRAESGPESYAHRWGRLSPYPLWVSGNGLRQGLWLERKWLVQGLTRPRTPGSSNWLTQQTLSSTECVPDTVLVLEMP